jgi:hypothetical protein
MFEPECQNIDCPQCLLGKIYFDRDIGYYCMLCGREFSAVDMEILIENKTITSSPAQKLKRKSPLEIKELPARKAKAKHVSPDVIEHKKPKQ